jgi:hypothetical protein
MVPTNGTHTVVDADSGYGVLASRHMVRGQATAQEVSVKVALVMFKFNDSSRDRFNLKQ